MDIQKTIDALNKNNIEAFYAKDKKEAMELLKSNVKTGSTVSVGGSVTLNELGVLDYLKGADINFLDRYKEGLSKDEVNDIYRKSFFADTYITSSNAITEKGELYNVDGNGNRVAAITYGPKEVIIIAGKNKIVKDIDEAVHRVKTVAAPKNCVRLGIETYCKNQGKCVQPEGEIGSGCRNDRICCSFTVTSYQRVKNRIKVIIVDENLGY